MRRLIGVGVLGVLGACAADMDSAAIEESIRGGRKRGSVAAAQNDLGTGGDAGDRLHPVFAPTDFGDGALPAGDAQDCFAFELETGQTLHAGARIDSETAGSKFWLKFYWPGSSLGGGTSLHLGTMMGTEAVVENRDAYNSPAGVWSLCVEAESGSGTYHLRVEVRDPDGVYNDMNRGDDAGDTYYTSEPPAVMSGTGALGWGDPGDCFEVNLAPGQTLSARAELLGEPVTADTLQRLYYLFVYAPAWPWGAQEDFTILASRSSLANPVFAPYIGTDASASATVENAGRWAVCIEATGASYTEPTPYSLAIDVL